MTDQQRYDALSVAGNTVLETPDLDRLAKQGLGLKTPTHHAQFVHRQERRFLPVIRWKIQGQEQTKKPIILMKNA